MLSIAKMLIEEGVGPYMMLSMLEPSDFDNDHNVLDFLCRNYTMSFIYCFFLVDLLKRRGYIEKKQLNERKKNRGNRIALG